MRREPKARPYANWPHYSTGPGATPKSSSLTSELTAALRVRGRQVRHDRPVDQRQPHLAMVAAAVLIAQQTPAHGMKPCFLAGQHQNRNVR